MKRRIFEIIEPAKEGDKISGYFDKIINLLILASVVILYLETFDQLRDTYDRFFRNFLITSTFIFSVEYVLRAWTSDLKYPRLKRFSAMKSYATSKYAIIDFLATFPAYFPGVTSKVFLSLRVFRLGRLFRSPKFRKLNEAFELFGGVVRRKKSELVMTFSIVIILILIVALFMYYAENIAQPDVFRNVYDSIWWATITLTTVGYGDIFPITPIGRLLGMIIALLGIGLIALPTGILSSGLMEELDSRKAKIKGKMCPHCGKLIG